MHQFQVEIAEIVMGLAGHVLAEIALDEEHCHALDYVCPCPSDAEVDRSLAGNERPFNLEMSVYQSEGGVAVPFLEVAFSHAHVHDR